MAKRSALDTITSTNKAAPKSHGIMGEFRDFLAEYKVLPLAIAFIIGLAANTLIKALVDSIIMPLITPFVPGGSWQTATVTLGPFVIGWGAFVGALIYFIIIAFVVFMIAKYALKEEKIAKK